MSVSGDEFMTKSAYDVVEIIFAVGVSDHCVENRLQQYVARFFNHSVKVVSVDCIDKLVRFLDEIYPYAFVRLRPVPRTAVFGQQRCHDFDKVVGIVSFCRQQIIGRNHQSRDIRKILAVVDFGKRYVCQIICLFDTIYQINEFFVAVYVGQFDFYVARKKSVVDLSHDDGMPLVRHERNVGRDVVRAVTHHRRVGTNACKIRRKTHARDNFNIVCLLFQLLHRAVVETAAVHAKRNVAFFVFRQKRFYDFFVKFGKIFRRVVCVVERFCGYSVFFKKIVRRRFCRFDVNIFCLFQKLFGAETQIVLIKPESNYGNHSTLPES